jgi:hypothetical protein
VSNFDEALERFHRVDLEYAGGLSNHGPMGAEALESLGHHALIPAFVDIYVPRLPTLEPGIALSESESEILLGDVSRRADWVATYEQRLESGDWQTVVATEVPRLLPGIFAAAGHGLLRTAHAIRSLEREDSPLRRRELARGLAYWAARFQSLPGLPGSRAKGSVVEQQTIGLKESLSNWPKLGEAAARRGFFFDVVKRLEGYRPFSTAVEQVPVPSPESIDAFLTTLCREAAHRYLLHPAERVAYVHGLTIPSAFRLLVPHVPAEDACMGVAFALQAVGALHSIFGEEETETPVHDEEVVRVSGDWDEIRYHAACSIQEHSIKMVEACWREDQHSADPSLRLAAADAALKIEGRGQASTC